MFKYRRLSLKVKALKAELKDLAMHGRIHTELLFLSP